MPNMVMYAEPPSGVRLMLLHELRDQPPAGPAAERKGGGPWQAVQGGGARWGGRGVVGYPQGPALFHPGNGAAGQLRP